MADVAGLYRIGNRADRFFNRHGRIEPARTVNVDVIGPEPAQCVGEKVLHGGGPRIHAEPGARRIAHRTELDADDCALSPSAKGLPDQQLVMAHSVVVAGVEQRDAGVERGLNGGDALPIVSRTVEIRHAHASETECRDSGTGRAERSRDHVVYCYHTTECFDHQSCSPECVAGRMCRWQGSRGIARPRVYNAAMPFRATCDVDLLVPRDLHALS